MAGWRQLDEKEKLAQFYFWREIGRHMNVRNYFESLDELLKFLEHALVAPQAKAKTASAPGGDTS